MDIIQEQALLLAQQGLLVFPCFLNKRPATRHGLYDATDDPDRIKRFLWHDRLIGVPTGGISGLCVLDIDVQHGGELWAIEHADRLRNTRAHETKSGGLHLLFQCPDYNVPNSAGRIAKGIDTRGDGGYIIWWPAHGYDQINYDLDPALWPRWLDPPEPPKREAPTAGRVPHRTELLGLLEFVAMAKEGERNAQLFWAACRLGELAIEQEARCRNVGRGGATCRTRRARGGTYRTFRV